MIRRHGNFEIVQDRADVTRNDILEAALDVFSEKGYAGANTKNIAAAAGVATGSVYRYFKNKKVIFIEVINMLQWRMSFDIFAKAQSMLDEGKPLREALRMLGVYSVESHRSNRMFFREVMALEATDKDISAIGRERDRRIRGHLFAFLSSQKKSLKVSDLEAAAELTRLVVEEVSHQAVIFDSDVGEDRLVSQMVMMLEGYLLGS
ncbi:TetR/AcrR family transcriptional regulator [Desulfovibrio sp. JC022]|uniref:TetR/AcrR family transcriptional regulator n=1 Tax=Desulfovibrio sp. JC022 TaxID=2593642 RepID=UPI0013D5233B|nr:TetR/AcrR family transcriptional regulator [Desulfovibrio sp. JC022]NDV23067.1 TetR/AcrR family transcriptional regulator [Desulfovibrio sp. JC022]